MESLIENLRALRANWKRVPILGVLCGPNTAGQLLECFAEGLDDFVECPVRETDIVVRARRLMLHAAGSGLPPLPESRLHLDFLVGESAPFGVCWPSCRRLRAP